MNTLKDWISSQRPGPIVVCVGGQKMIGKVFEGGADYFNLEVDRAVATGNTSVGLAEVPPAGKTHQILVPYAAVTWAARPVT